VTEHRVPGASFLGGVERVLSGDELGSLMDAIARHRREEALDELLSAQREQRGQGGGGRGGWGEGARAAEAAG
jgi:hypothetical protein